MYGNHTGADTGDVTNKTVRSGVNITHGAASAVSSGSYSSCPRRMQVSHPHTSPCRTSVLARSYPGGWHPPGIPCRAEPGAPGNFFWRIFISSELSRYCRAAPGGTRRTLPGGPQSLPGGAPWQHPGRKCTGGLPSLCG